MRDVDDRLVVHDQLVLLDRPLQLADQQQPLGRVVVVLGAVEHGQVHLLARVHRHVGLAQQRLGVGAVVGEQRDADAAPRAQAQVADVERALELAEQAARDALRVAGVGDGDDQPELVAAEARDRVARAQRQLQADRDLDQEAVALLVAEGVVDLLELVEVEQHHRELVAGSRRTADRVLGAVVEEHTVREARQTVVQRDLLRRRDLSAQAAHEPPHPQNQGDVERGDHAENRRSSSPPTSSRDCGRRQGKGKRPSRAQISPRQPENRAAACTPYRPPGRPT